MSSKPSNLIYGIGTDIIEISRIKKAISRHGVLFLRKIFTPKEMHYCQLFRDPHPRFAGRFAAKEAIAKALGTGFNEKMTWLDIEILNTINGKPEVFLSSKLAKSPGTILLSISHCREYATATAILTAID